jgi:hypothetical protein
VTYTKFHFLTHICDKKKKYGNFRIYQTTLVCSIAGPLVGLTVPALLTEQTLV